MPSSAPSGRRVVIFDLDDTLIHSFAPYVRLHRKVARIVGLPVPSVAALIPYGATWEETVARLWPGHDLRAFFATYHALADAEAPRPVRGGVQAVQAVVAAGHRAFIVTKRSRLRLHLRLAQAGFDRAWFEGVFAAEDQPATKPDPRCFEPVWATLGARAPAIYVGDRAEDRAAAHAAGLGFVAVRTGPEALRGFPEGMDPQHVLGSVAELPQWLAARAER